MVAEVTPVTWDSLWSVEGLVALGALALAVVTAFLAWRTSAMAAKTAELAEFTKQDVAIATQSAALSQTAIEASVRPVLIGVPPGRFMSEAGQNLRVPGTRELRTFNDLASVPVQEVEGRLFVSVPFRNEGAGIAFMRKTHFKWKAGGRWWLGEMNTAELPPDEVVHTLFAIEPDEEEDAPTVDTLLAHGEFSVTVHYSDLAGNVWSSVLNAKHIPKHDWEVTVVLGHEGRIGDVGLPP